jgi:hypothetical protein
LVFSAADISRNKSRNRLYYFHLFFNSIQARKLAGGQIFFADAQEIKR